MEKKKEQAKVTVAGNAGRRNLQYYKIETRSSAGLPDRDSLYLYTRQMQAEITSASEMSICEIDKEGKKLRLVYSCNRRKDRNKTVLGIKRQEILCGHRIFLWEMDFMAILV